MNQAIHVRALGGKDVAAMRAMLSPFGKEEVKRGRARILLGRAKG